MRRLVLKIILRLWSLRRSSGRGVSLRGVHRLADGPRSPYDSSGNDGIHCTLCDAIRGSACAWNCAVAVAKESESGGGRGNRLGFVGNLEALKSKRPPSARFCPWTPGRAYPHVSTTNGEREWTGSSALGDDGHRSWRAICGMRSNRKNWVGAPVRIKLRTRMSLRSQSDLKSGVWLAAQRPLNAQADTIFRSGHVIRSLEAAAAARAFYGRWLMLSV